MIYKMALTYLLIGTALLLPGTTSFAGNISGIKAAELACHRVEKLVSLRKLDMNFVTKLERISLALKNTPDVPGSAFEAILTQMREGNGPDNSVKLVMDADGRVLRNEILSTGPLATTGPQWPDKDPLSLIESTLHHVLDNPNLPDVNPFFVALNQITIRQTAQGTNPPLAEIELTNQQNASLLLVHLHLNGDLIDMKVVTP